MDAVSVIKLILIFCNSSSSSIRFSIGISFLDSVHNIDGLCAIECVY